MPACCLIRSSLSSHSCRFRSCLPMAAWNLQFYGRQGRFALRVVRLLCLVAAVPIAASAHFHCVQLCRRRMDAAGPRCRIDPDRSRPFWWLEFPADVLFLGWFKYANFVVDNLNWAAGSHIQLDRIALPLAISFFTFQKIAYLIDTARGETRPSEYSTSPCSRRSTRN